MPLLALLLLSGFILVSMVVFLQVLPYVLVSAKVLSVFIFVSLLRDLIIKFNLNFISVFYPNRSRVVKVKTIANTDL